MGFLLAVILFISGSHVHTGKEASLCACSIFNSYTMGSSGLPDIYTQSPRAAGPRAEGVHIRQTTRAHGITTM